MMVSIRKYRLRSREFRVAAPGNAVRAAGASGLTRLFDTDDDLAATIARVTLGAVILPHGLQKVFGAFGGYGFSATMQWLTTDVGIPYPIALLDPLTTSLGAAALIVGVLGRVAALGVAGIMVGAIVTTHLPHGFFMNWEGTQQGEGFEFHLLALGLAGIVVLRGSGRYSVDRLLQARRRQAQAFPSTREEHQDVRHRKT
jgi:putative oxidoreductase